MIMNGWAAWSTHMYEEGKNNKSQPQRGLNQEKIDRPISLWKALIGGVMSLQAFQTRPNASKRDSVTWPWGTGPHLFYGGSQLGKRLHHVLGSARSVNLRALVRFGDLQLVSRKSAWEALGHEFQHGLKGHHLKCTMAEHGLELYSPKDWQSWDKIASCCHCLDGKSVKISCLYASPA